MLAFMYIFTSIYFPIFYIIVSFSHLVSVLSLSRIVSVSDRVCILSVDGWRIPTQLLVICLMLLWLAKFTSSEGGFQ